MTDFIEEYANAVETSHEVSNEPQVVETAVVAETTQVPEVKVETPKAESTEAKTETTVQPSLFDKFKPAEEVKPEAKVEPTVEAVVENKVETTTEQSSEQLQALQAELEKYKSSPLAKLLGGDYDITNVDLKDFLRKAVGEDFTKLSDDDLIQKSLESNPLFDSLSEDEKAEEIELQKSKLEGMSKLEKLQHRNNLINELDKSKDANEIFKSLEEIQNKQKDSIANPDEWYQEKLQNDFEAKFNEAKQAIANNANSLVGQEYRVGNFGYKVSAEDAKAIEDAYVSEVTNFNADDKSFNLFKVATYEKAIEKAIEYGKTLAIKGDANPSQNMTNSYIATNDNKGMASMHPSDWLNVKG